MSIGLKDESTLVSSRLYPRGTTSSIATREFPVARATQILCMARYKESREYIAMPFLGKDSLFHIWSSFFAFPE